MDNNLILKNEGSIATIAINTNEYNTFNSHLIKDFGKLFSNLRQNKKIRVAILTGSRKSFCAGADIREMALFNTKNARKFAVSIHKVFNTIENSDIIFIAAVNGYALGAGNELAIACDLRYASPDAKFGQPEVRLGIPPGGGASARLPRLIGAAKSMEMIYAGKIISAREAEKIGLVNKVARNPMKEAKKTAKEILQNSPNAVSVSKKILPHADKVQLKNEINEWVECFNHHDQKEGMHAFIEKRIPRWKK
jgi:enoyl-CoA hydratase